MFVIQDCSVSASIDLMFSSFYGTALNSIRVATGKCGLLLSKKFPFFRQLIDMAENSQKLRVEARTESSSSQQQNADVNDLLGYWATIATEIEQIDGSFERLRNWREISRWAVDMQPQTPARFQASKLPRGRQVSAETIASQSIAQLKTAAPKALKVIIVFFYLPPF